MHSNPTKRRITRSVIAKVYGDKEIAKHFSCNALQYNIICDMHKPQIFSIGKQHYLNMCAGFNAKQFPMSSFSEETMNKLNIFLNYMKEILASNDEAAYIYLLKWFSNALKGNKNDTILFLKSLQGTGKSTMSDFI